MTMLQDTLTRKISMTIASFLGPMWYVRGLDCALLLQANITFFGMVSTTEKKKSAS